MTEEADDKRVTFRLPKMEPRPIEVDGLGELYVVHPSMKVHREVAKIRGRPVGADLQIGLLCALVLDKNKQPLDRAAVSAWTDDQRAAVLQKAGAVLGATLPQENGDETGTIPSGDAMADRILHVFEQAEKEHVESQRRLTEQLSKNSQLGGLAIRKLLEDSAPTKRLLDEQISRVLGLRSSNPVHAVLAERPPPMPAIDFPRNPVHDTNDLLKDLAEKLDQVVQLAATTAQLNKQTTDAATSILTEFNQGAEASKKALGRSLWLAGGSLLVALIALGIQVMDQLGESEEQEAARATQIAAAERLADRIEARGAKDAEAIAAAIREGDQKAVDAIDRLSEASKLAATKKTGVK